MNAFNVTMIVIVSAVVIINTVDTLTAYWLSKAELKNKRVTERLRELEKKKKLHDKWY
jgi:ABC-type sulfate transport system permease component